MKKVMSVMVLVMLMLSMDAFAGNFSIKYRDQRSSGGSYYFTFDVYNSNRASSFDFIVTASETGSNYAVSDNLINEISQYYPSQNNIYYNYSYYDANNLGEAVSVHAQKSFDYWVSKQSAKSSSSSSSSSSQSSVPAKPANKATAAKKVKDIGSMVKVKGGTFQMGSNDGESNEKPIHSVTVSDFYIGKYEVTQKEWVAIMGSNPSKYQGDNLPVEQVSWDDCQEFIKKLNVKTGKSYRLPSEAEWEYAARGGSKSKDYKYSGSNDLSAVAWFADNSGSNTHLVGQKQANELGIYDMTGNIWEWCSDWYGDYSSGSQANPKGVSSGSYRLLRGGSFNDDDPPRNGCCRVAYRLANTPSNRYDTHGFRLVRTY